VNDLDALIRGSLDTPQRDPNWNDVVARAGSRRRGRPIVIALVAAVALIVGAAAVADTVGHGFSDWLEGSPGTPASSADSEELENPKSFAPLDSNIDVRELLHADYGGKTYRLIGFRSGGAVCVRIAQAAIDEGGDVNCVPADQLAASHDLALPLAVDKPLTDPGPGEAPGPQASFGLVAAEAEQVWLDGEGGPYRAAIGNGAFIAIRPHGRATISGYAIDHSGRRRPIPLAPSQTRETERYRTGLPVLGPARVERRVEGGSVGWLARGEERGDAVPERLLEIFKPRPRPPGLPANLPGPVGLDPARGDFARLIKPDNAYFARLMVGRTASGDLCYGNIGRGGVGFGCIPETRAFDRWPFVPGWTYAGAGSQFVTAEGIASDVVARMQLYLGSGDVQEVALRDNAYFALVQRAKFPARLVARDAQGRVIGVMTMRAF
jgi:hypothetical protein